jgi:S-adenosylmethionine hydrolase
MTAALETAQAGHTVGTFVPSGIITLTSDFGLRDPFVGVMKGRILEAAPTARIVDLTHEIVAHWPAEAGFWIARSYTYFPRGTVHVAVVDPGVGTTRDIAVAELDGHVFLAPDNGLLAEVAARSGAVLRHLRNDLLPSLGVDRPSATFHGRDIFAPVAAALATSRVSPDHIGRRVDALVPAWVDEPQVERERVSGVVITIDHFGNLLTNIDRALIDGFVDPVVHAGHLLLPLRRTYGDMRPGDALALINSFGVVEIAVAEGRAADALGLSRGAPVIVRDGVRRN